MEDKPYFTAETTSLTLPKRGCLAIYAGEKPRKNANGSTSYSMRGPMLIMPNDMWHDDKDLIEKVAKLLNDNAHLFFDSAKAPDTAQP